MTDVTERLRTLLADLAPTGEKLTEAKEVLYEVEQLERRPKVITGGATHGRLLHWVSRARSPDRERFRWVHFKDGVATATDGFRIHAANLNAYHDLDGLYGYKIRGGGAFESILVEAGRTFPDLSKIAHGLKQPPTFEIAFNPKLLADTAAGIKDCLVLRAWEKKNIVEILGAGQEVYALLMPMHQDHKTFWRPPIIQQAIDRAASHKESTA
jgi:hypothetical protein